MLNKCPECELQVSDKAYSCPHCGFPLKQQVLSRQISKKRMRLPNGFGQISEIKGRNLRKPFRAMVTVGTSSTGRPICKLLEPCAYFKSYKEAYEALLEYNTNPYSIPESITVEELHERWLQEYKKRVSEDTARKSDTVWKQCSELYACKICELRTMHVKECMDKVSSPNVKIKIKGLFSMMLDYAVEYEITDHNCAKNINVSQETHESEESRESHIAFTDEEMQALWNNRGNKFVNIILVGCYTGWRPNELCNLTVASTNLNEWFFVGGSKTEAGKDRTVPIHEKIRGLVVSSYKASVASESKYLFQEIGGKYYQYKREFARVVEALGLNPAHTPHDCRVQFITMAKKYQVDEYAIKRIAGHKIVDITENVYTKRDLAWLASEISKIEKV